MVNKQISKLAVMGGTFDPIHNGHLVTAEAVRHEFGIDEVLFMPTGNPPHKSNMNVTSSEHRYLMTVLATADNPYFNVSRIEIDRQGMTYTVDTMKELKAIYGEDTELYFITGADAIHQILTWKNHEELLKICTFIAVTRPGYDKKELLGEIERLKSQFQSNIKFLEVPALAISSSDIRQRAQESRPIKYLVTEPVENYIRKHNIYESNITFTNTLITQMSKYVGEQLSAKRYFHTKGVVQMALQLAKVHGENTDQAFIAALFHDIAKEIDKEKMKELCDEYQIAIDEFEAKHIGLVHGKVGAELLKRVWDVKDEDILNSIRFHTTGRPNMTNLEKIIYLADMLEHGRKPFEGIEELRRLVLYDLDKAMYRALIYSGDYITKVKKGLVHPITDILIEEYKPFE